MITSVYDIIAIVVTVVGILFVWYFLVGLIKYLMRKNDINKYEIDLAYNTHEIEEELDQIILDAIKEYNILSMFYRSDIGYINNNTENEMRDRVTEIVSMKLSPAFMNKLYLIYAPEHVQTVIARKIYLAITNIVVENNTGTVPVGDEKDTTS